MNKIKKLFLTFLFFSTICNLHSQEVLNNYNTSWSTVMPGTVICQPEETTYGFCLATDARNVIGFTKDGKQLWEKSIGKSKNIEITVLEDDFVLLYEKNDNILTLLNPSGTKNWSKNPEIILREKPFIGRDGRFFVYSNNTVICFGINGICKWKLETPVQKNIPIQELPDGSLIIFLTENNGKTQGIRVSPFGEVMEEILFSGEIVKSATINEGILLIFSDGSAGLFSLNEGKSVNKWVVPQKNTNYSFVVSKDRSNFLLLELYSDNITVNHISKNDGSISNRNTIKGINGTKLIAAYLNSSGVFLSDIHNACFYDTKNVELWSARLPAVNQQKWNYIFNLNSNYFVFCDTDWSLKAYKVNQDMNLKDDEKNAKNYESFYRPDFNIESIFYLDKFEKDITDINRITLLNEGFYAEKERIYISEVLSICELYNQISNTVEFGTKPEKSVFDTDTKSFESILIQLTKFCNDNTQKCTANLIKNSQNNNYVKVLMNNCNGYDPNGEILDALQLRSSITNHKDIATLKSICNAVYSVCEFMGRPAYNTKGKVIIKSFMGPDYDIQVRTYARDILRKIMELDL